MNIAIALAALTAVDLVLGLSAGLLLGLVAFDLLPEIFEMNTDSLGGVPVVSLALVVGFLLLHFAEKIFGSHEPAHSDYGHDHEHSINLAGTLGALAMAGHVFLDGLALGLAFQVSDSLGYAVFIAILAHAFSDGLNTVSLLVKSGHWTKTSFMLLGADALMRISGAALATYIVFSEPLMAIYLATFSGFVICRHPSKLTMLATVFGVIAMWLIVGNIGE